jgi:hypothetical protein
MARGLLLLLLTAVLLPRAFSLLFHPNESLWTARENYSATLWDNQMIRAADGSLHLFYLAGLWTCVTSISISPLHRAPCAPVRH